MALKADGNLPNVGGSASDIQVPQRQCSIQQASTVPQSLEQLAAEVKLLRDGLTTVVEAVDVVQPALQKEVELRAVRDQQVTNLEIQIKDLRSDLCEILTLKVKPRLASLEKEASETRRRLLPMPTCSVAGEHTAACRHCRRGPATCRAGSPEDWKKARKELQDIGEALLDRARRELQRQEELVQNRLAVEQRQQVALDVAGRDMSNEARGILRAAEQSAQGLAEQQAQEVARSVAAELLKKAEMVLQSEIAEVNAVSREATAATVQLREQLTEAQQMAEIQKDSMLQQLKEQKEGSATLRDGYSKAEKGLRSEVARVSSIANSASQEATRAFEQISRLQAGVRGVEETLERRTQWMRTSKNELEVSISEVTAASLSAMSRSVRSMSEVEEHERCRLGDVARLERFEEATERQAQKQAKVLDELREAVLAAAEQRHGEEQNLMKKVHDVLRASKDKFSKEGRETVEAAGRAVAQARAELQQDLLSHTETQGRRAVTTVREELSREVATLRRDVEEQVREDLRKQLVSLGQDCSVSIEAQVKDSSAEISHHLERHLEELFRKSRAQERSEVLVIANKTESACEEQVRQLLWQVEDQTKLAASKTEEGWNLAQTLQERAAAAVNFAEAEAQSLAARGEAFAEEHAKRAEAEALSLAQRGEERAAVAAKLSQAEAERLAKMSESKVVEFVKRAEEQVAHATQVGEALSASTKEEALAALASAEEHAAKVAAKMEDSGARCKELMEDLSRSHLQKVESMQEVVKGTLQKMEALEAEYRASLEVFNAMKDQAFAAAHQAFEAQEESTATRRSVEESRAASEKALMEVRSELSAFIDEQRVFCGFIDTEQRSYQELIRQEVNALSRLVDATLRMDPPWVTSQLVASPASTLEGLQPLEPMGELPMVDEVLRSAT